MTRYWAASLLLHLVFYGAINWRPITPIENPVVGVVLLESFASTPSAVKSPSSPPSKKSWSSPSPVKHSGRLQNSSKISSEPKLVMTNHTAPEADSSTENEMKDSTSSSEKILNHREGGVFNADVGTLSVRPRVLRQFMAKYPQSAKKAGIEGAVKLSVLIDTNGKVRQVGVIEGPGHGLNEMAQEAMKKFIFSPAERLGEKVPVRIVYVYRFRLESR